MNFYQVLMVLCPLDPDPKHLRKEHRKGNTKGN